SVLRRGRHARTGRVPARPPGACPGRRRGRNGGESPAGGRRPAPLGYSGRVALLAGLAVSQIGEFSFVLAREGRGTGLLSENLYQTFLAVAVLTMLVTPFLLQGGPALLDRLERLVPLDRLLPGLRPGAIAA